MEATQTKKLQSKEDRIPTITSSTTRLVSVLFAVSDTNCEAAAFINGASKDFMANLVPMIWFVVLSRTRKRMSRQATI